MPLWNRLQILVLVMLSLVALNILKVKWRTVGCSYILCAHFSKTPLDVSKRTERAGKQRVTGMEFFQPKTKLSLSALFCTGSISVICLAKRENYMPALFARKML